MTSAKLDPPHGPGPNLQRIGREVALAALGQLASALGLLLTVRLLSNTLSSTDYGLFILGQTAAVLVSQTLLGPLANAAQRFYAAAREADQLPELWFALRIFGLTAAALMLAVGLGMTLALRLTLNEALGPLVLVGIAFAVLSGWETLFDALQNAERRRGVVAWHQGLRQWLRPLLAFVWITASRGGATAALVGYASASCLILISQARVSPGLVRKSTVPWRSAYVARVWNYAAPFASWGLFTWAHLASDRWALELATGPGAVAAYAVTFQLGAQPVYLLGTAAAQFVEPIVYARAGLGADADRLRQAFRLNMRLAVSGAAFLVVLVLAEVVAHPLIFAILAPQYQSVSYLLPLATIAGSLFSLGQLIALGSTIVGSSRALVAPKIVSSILGIALNVSGAYLFGIEGVLVAGIVTGLVFFIWTTRLSMSLLKAHA